MQIVNTARQVQAPGIDLDGISVTACLNVPVNTRILQGSVWCLDVTQPTISPASLVAGSVVPGIQGPVNAPWTQTCEVVVPPWHTNVGTNPQSIGVYQGPTFQTSAAALSTFLPLKIFGSGLVLAAAEGGTAVNVGSNLVASLTQYGAKSGTAALLSQIGVASAYFINTTVPLAISSGAQTVVVPNIVGMTTLNALTIDTFSSGVQEIVTPSAVVSGVNANQTYTIANAGSVTTLTATTGGIAASYTTTAADTATTAAAALVQAINASAAVAGSATAAPIILPATNAAGVVTVRANVSGTAGNSITTVAAVSGGSVTMAAGAGTMASGTASSFTATFANAHGTNTPVQGFQKTNAAALIPGTASALTEYLINAFIRVS